MSKPKYSIKQQHQSECISRRFANPKQELQIQTTAGALREFAAASGGHNKPRVPYKRKEDGKRDKKVPYGKARWGTLGTQLLKTAPEAVRGTSPKVAKQFAKAEAYKAKISSKKWRKAAGDR